MDMTRKEAIKTIRTALKKRSGKPWSVTGGRGTAYCWLRIDAPPKRKDEYGQMSISDSEELVKLLDLEKVYHDGISIPASNQYWQEYMDRAMGIKPTVLGAQYWD